MAERPGGVLAFGSEITGHLEQVLKSVPEHVPDDREDHGRAQYEGYERSRGRRVLRAQGQQTNITQATLASLALLAILLIEQGVSDGIIVVTIWPHPAPDVGPLESRRSMWVKGMKAHRAGVRFPSDSPFVPNSVS